MAALLSMLTLTIRELSKEDVKKLDGVVLQLFLTALDYRASTGINVSATFYKMQLVLIACESVSVALNMYSEFVSYIQLYLS